MQNFWKKKDNFSSYGSRQTQTATNRWLRERKGARELALNSIAEYSEMGAREKLLERLMGQNYGLEIFLVLQIFINVGNYLKL